MKLLIVDDEIIITEDLKNSIEWSKLGITEVFTAFNIRQAKEVFFNSEIDIMLCDIEMPQGSGLELLAWVRKNFPKTESIFLTCHADFSYAKEAIRLGSLDYILKPVPYMELEKAISKAIEKINKESKLLEKSLFGEFWFKHQPLVIEHFWIDILNRTIRTNQKAIKEAAEARNIPYAENMKFLPVLFNIRRWHNDWNLQDQKLMEYGFKNIVNEVVLKDGSKGQLIEMERGKFIIILSIWNNRLLDIGTLKKDCQACLNASNEYLKCDIACHIGSEAYAYELPVMVDNLYEQEKDNVFHDNRVFLLNEQNKVLDNIDLPDMGMWSIMLAEGSGESLLSEILTYLDGLSKVRGFKAGKLKEFHHDFMQMVYSTLKQKGIQAHKLFNDTESVKLYDNSDNSVRDLLVWIRHVVMKVVDYTGDVEKTQTIVNKVKQYITVNVEQEMTREEVANHLYLNPDYLDRIFKKETGMSVTKFMVQERLNKAQELLSKTELPVSVIAVAIGYKNMSHFSAAFKKHTNMNPIDYRKEAHK
ncbi:two-component system response regulator YesN [Anaerobacterium chartisolvens]|uniref:Stage 0 sporulation protein A homolog n=1 Tax=Anaerobacterium chartisolvens TaxID=1297424 RepID=A0A369AKM8_9FIRM|nr:helix-turn-helix domain-containing protein [Anaerobacterium chartisolvens]RCX09922.1 two-component system response regulator YesN [Anaerobacterium chartisolvens]